MPLLTIAIAIIIVGILLYLVNSYVPMDAKIKKILNIVVVIILIVWILRETGVWSYLNSINF